MLKKQAIIVGITSLLMAVTVSSFAKDKQDAKQNKTVYVKAGREFSLTLKSNITTGYQWRLAKAVNREYLLLTGLRYITKKPKLPGSGGREEWTFKAVKPGTAIISFEYVRPWEKKATPAKARNFVVIIR